MANDKSIFSGPAPERLILEIEGKRYGLSGRVVAIIWQLLQWRNVFSVESFKGKIVIHCGVKGEVFDVNTDASMLITE